MGCIHVLDAHVLHINKVVHNQVVYMARMLPYCVKAVGSTGGAKHIKVFRTPTINCSNVCTKYGNMQRGHANVGSISAIQRTRNESTYKLLLLSNGLNDQGLHTPTTTPKCMHATHHFQRSLAKLANQDNNGLKFHMLGLYGPGTTCIDNVFTTSLHS